MSERDTHFAGFAKLLLEELKGLDGVWIDTNRMSLDEEWKTIIAQRAYDLALHVMRGSQSIADLASVSDLTELPEVKDE